MPAAAITRARAIAAFVPELLTLPEICPAAGAGWRAMRVAAASMVASADPAPAGATRLHVMAISYPGAKVLMVRRVPMVLTVLAGLGVAGYMLFAPGNGVVLPAIRQRGAWLVIENQSRSPWRDVNVTLNSYYRGVSPAVSAGGRLEAPLASFVTGLGQRFNTAREQVRRVEVRATDGAGNPVVLEWDEQTGPPLVMEK